MTSSPATTRPDPLYALMLRLGEGGELDLFISLEDEGCEGFTRANWNVFANISPQGSRPSEIARRLGIRDQSVGALLLELEGQGYVERLPDPTDERAKLVSLTERGRLAQKLACTALDEMETSWAGTLGPAGLAALRQALEELYATWRAEATEELGLGQYGLRI